MGASDYPNGKFIPGSSVDQTDGNLLAQPPYRSVFQTLSWDQEGRAMPGTGFAIGPHHLLTSAHNTYARADRAYLVEEPRISGVMRAVAVINPNSDSEPLTHAYCADLDVSDNPETSYTSCEPGTCIVLDFSLLHFNQAIFTHFLKIDPVYSGEIIPRMVGYPDAGQSDFHDYHVASGSQCTSTSEDKYSMKGDAWVINYQVSAFRGNSGSPVYDTNMPDDDIRILGIHSQYNRPTPPYTSGIRLRPAVAEKISQWKKLDINAKRHGRYVFARTG